MDRYSFSLTTFSPSGKLGQIEHALAAVGNGATSVGIKATNGVVLACERKAGSTLIERDTVLAVEPVCDSIGMVYSGMGPDFRVLVEQARVLAQQYIRMYNEDPPVNVLVKELAATMQESTQRGGVRPFGVSLLVAGMDHRGPSLYQVDPSGAYFSWKATSIGKNMVSAKTFLEKRHSEELELEDAVHTAILTIKEGFEGMLDESSLNIGIVQLADPLTSQDDRQRMSAHSFRLLSKNEIKDFLVNIK